VVATLQVNCTLSIHLIHQLKPSYRQKPTPPPPARVPRWYEELAASAVVLQICREMLGGSAARFDSCSAYQQMEYVNQFLTYMLKVWANLSSVFRMFAKNTNL